MAIYVKVLQEIEIKTNPLESTLYSAKSQVPPTKIFFYSIFSLFLSFVLNQWERHAIVHCTIWISYHM